MRVVHPPSPRTRSRGLTLVELLVVIAIVGILAGLAVPTMQDFLVRNRSAVLANELTATLLRARNEAVNVNACVVLCPIARPFRQGANWVTPGPEPACLASADWSGGWVAFRQPDCNALAAGPDAAAGRPVVASTAALPTGYTVVKTGASTDRLVFSPAGHVRAGDAGRFDLRFGTAARASDRGICVNRLGRTRVVALGAAC